LVQPALRHENLKPTNTIIIVITSFSYRAFLSRSVESLGKDDDVALHCQMGRVSGTQHNA
jgi:rhodanese-related sulfurtransferase